MDRRIPWRPTPRGARRVALAAGVLLVLAACGSQRAATSPAPASSPVPGGSASASVALCKGIPTLSSVVITPTASLRATQPGLLPRGTTLREPPAVRHLATVLCGLPRAPHGPLSCPADFGGSVRLVFAAGGRQFPPVTVRTSGCLTVTGLGPVRRVPPATLRAFGMALGLKFPVGPASPSGGGVNP